MGKQNSPCGCCCRDVCRVKTGFFPNDDFAGDLSDVYEISDGAWDTGTVVGLSSSCLRLAGHDSGSCFLRLNAGKVQGRRIKISADVKPYAGSNTDNHTCKYGVFIGGAFSAILECGYVDGAFLNGANFKVYSGVDEFGNGGTLEYNGSNLSFNSGALIIGIDYDGITPGVYSIGVSWSRDFGDGHQFQQTITFPTSDTEITVGHVGELGGGWDSSCIVFNHNAGHCFPCLGCEQEPFENFPIKWLLSYPELDQSESDCGFCEELQGDWELIYVRRKVLNAIGDVGCAWVTTQECKPCRNKFLLENNIGACWQLSHRGLEATGSVQALGYSLYSPIPFDCTGPNIFRFSCTVCQSPFPPFKNSCQHPEFLTIVPVFPEP